jgi:hypothetical protein
MIDVFARVVAMEAACVPNSIAADYASFDYPAGERLFWTNRLDPITAPVTQGKGVDEYLFTIPIVMRLHSGWITQGLPGALEVALQTVHIPTVLVYFHERRDLVYKAAQAPLIFAQPDIFSFSCSSGLTIFTDEIDNNRKMLGAEFRLTLGAQIPIKRTI